MRVVACTYREQAQNAAVVVARSAVENGEFQALGRAIIQNPLESAFTKLTASSSAPESPNDAVSVAAQKSDRQAAARILRQLFEELGTT